MAVLAEVFGTFGVIVSMIFIIVEINQNNVQASAATTQAFFASVRELDLMVASDPVWSDIVLKGRDQDANLSGVDQYRYDAYVAAVIDLWDEMFLRYQDKLTDPLTLSLWEGWFQRWAKRHVHSSTWDRIKWNYDHWIADKVEAAIGYGNVD